MAREAEQPMTNGTWPVAKQWPDVGYAQIDGRWFRLAHIGSGRYEVIDGPFGTYQRALLAGHEAGERSDGHDAWMRDETDVQRAMTSEQLESLEVRHRQALEKLFDLAVDDVPILLMAAHTEAQQTFHVMVAEVDRLRAREAALLAQHAQAMAIVRVVADDPCAVEGSDEAELICTVCGATADDYDNVSHKSTCLVEQARALLATIATDASDAPDTDTDDPPSLYWK